MPPPSQPSAAKMRRMARAVIEHHTGKAPRTVHQKSGGLTNFVFEARHGDGPFIVRISADRGKINAYIKEQWATAKAREVGVPTPQILEVGNEVVPFPYMILRRVEGNDSTHHPARMRIVHQMGHFTALIHTIATSGFGQTFDWSGNQLSRNKTWKDYLHGEMNLDGKLDILRRHRMLTKPQAGAVREAIEHTEGSRKRPVLNHGDMRLKNVLADNDGKITAIIDWEDCISSVAPYWDLSVALHDLSIDAKEEFISGYGISLKDFRIAVPVIKALNIINYAAVIEELANQKDEKKLELYRARLSGAFDLYSLP